MNFDHQPVGSVFNLVNGDFDKVDDLLNKLCNRRTKQVAMVKEILKKVVDSGLFTVTGTFKHDNVHDSSEWKDIMRKVQEERANTKDLFTMVDMFGNRNGLMDRIEYGVLANRLGLPMSEHRITEVFAEIKKNAKEEESGDGEPKGLELNEEEFIESLQYLENRNIEMTLESMGTSAGMLIGWLVKMLFLLMLLFAFIFVGIEAFALGGSFGAVINSVIPAGNAES
jgi:hypothetical protein